jgi:hypothetical protein
MSRAIAFMLMATVALSALAGEGEDPVKRLEAAFRNPPATGILITFVGAGTQAEARGVAVGDVFLSYNGVATPDIPALGAAKQAVGELTEIKAVFLGPEGEKTVILAPGPIGVNGAPVVKGEPAGTLPEETGVRLDFSVLEGGEREAWYAFSLDGETKVGFEHVSVKVTGGKLFLRREVAFDGGEQWGVNHFDVTVVAELGPELTAVATRFENPISGWIGTGRRVTGEDGSAAWVKKWPEEDEVRSPLPGPVVPEYLVETLAELMPLQAGACFHFRPITEGMGSIGLPAALVVKGEEEIEFGAGTVKVWRIEQQRLGGTVNGTYFVSEDGRTLRTDYGGAMGTLTTKEAALADLHEDIQPRSAQ